MLGALVLVASGVSGHTPHDPANWAWLDAQDALEVEAIDRGDFDAAAQIMMRVWVAGPGRRVEDLDTRLRERAWEMAKLAEERDLERKPTPPIDPPAAGRLSMVTAPTLVMWGDADPAPIEEMAETLVGGIAGAQRLVFEDTAHLIPMERPAEFNRAVLEFLERHPLS
jgi:3-oxoadipate enol-lactonase